MRDGGNLGAFLFANLVDLQHEGDVVVGFEPGADSLAQHGRREWTERFAALDLLVEDVFHIRPTWITDDGAIPKGARAPFHASLKPADDIALRDLCGGTAAEIALVADALDRAVGRIEI